LTVTLRFLKATTAAALRRGLVLLVLTAVALPLAAVAGSGSATIWRVRNGAGTVYIAGSLHQLRPGQATLPESYGQAYGAARRLAMEINLEAITPAALASELLERAIDPEGRSLRSSLGEARWRRLQPRLAGLGMPEPVVDRFEPWAVALLLASSDVLRRGYAPTSGVEGQLQARAAADHKPIDGLETPAEQFALLDGLPRQDQLALLDLTLQETEAVGPRLEAIEKAWRAGDIKRLEALLLQEYRLRPDLYERMVGARNARWVAPVQGFLQRPDDTFVVVGLLHLLGDRGLIALLRARGLRPERFVEGRWQPDP
jgi:uncharacterized protein YbaP (TraB family)